MATIGGKIDKLFELRENKRALEKQLQELSTKMRETEEDLIQTMDQQGVTKSTGRKATVSITESVKPQVEDWDALYAYIHKRKYYHLLERRPSVTGCRELFETKGKIPGVVPFIQRKLNTRTL